MLDWFEECFPVPEKFPPDTLILAIKELDGFAPVNQPLPMTDGLERTDQLGIKIVGELRMPLLPRGRDEILLAADIKNDLYGKL